MPNDETSSGQPDNMNQTTASTCTSIADQAEEIWRAMVHGGDERNNALSAMLQAPATVQAILMQRSAEAAARHYATPEGEAELADWRAIQGEDFAGFEDEQQAA